MTGPPPGKPTVNVPSRIVIADGKVDFDRMSGVLEERVAAQLTKAVKILDAGGPWDPRVNLPDVQFTGAASRWSDDEKRAAKDAVGTAMVRGAQQARNNAGATKRSGGGGGGGKGGGGKRDKKDPPKVPMRAIKSWAEFTAVGDDAFNSSATQAMASWMLANPGKQLVEPYGFLFRLSGKPLQLWIVNGGKFVVQRSLLGPNWEKPSDPKPIEPEADAANIYLSLEREGLKLWRESVVDDVKNAIGKEPGSLGKTTAEADPKAPQAALEAEVKLRIEKHTAGWETSMKVYYRLYFGSSGGGIHPFSHKRSPLMPEVPRIDIVPIIDQIEIETGDEADAAALAAGGGDAGAGAGGDKGDGAGGSGDLTAPPGQNVGAGGRGIVVSESYRTGAGAANASIYPDVFNPDGKDMSFACKPYGDELPVLLLGDDAIRSMRPLIDRIARRLEMEPCAYPANFCLQAVRMIRIRASQVQNRFEVDQDGKFSTELVIGRYNESGVFGYEPYPSVGVQYLQHLAATVPMIRSLMHLVERYSYPKGKFGPHYWFKDVMDEAHQGCGLIWLTANQIMMQQLLNSSAHAVKQRHHNEEYTKVFTVLVRTHLAEQIETITLRTALEQFIAIAGKEPSADAYNKVFDKHLAQARVEYALRGSVDERKARLLLSHGHDSDLALRLSDETSYVFRRAEEKVVRGVGEILATDDEGWSIRATDGHTYTLDQLNRMIQLRQQVLSSIDPMLSQLQHKLVTTIRPMVDDPSIIPAKLDQLFTDMLGKNASVQQKNRADFEYAFEHAQIHRVDADASPAVLLAPTTVRGWNLGGIHALAHTTVGVHFQDDVFYLNAMGRLISQEYYWRTFVEDMVFFFGIAFTIICPPLGAALSFAANLAMGLEKYGHAKEQEEIYGAMINPDQVIDYAELQIDLFTAKLQIGMSFLELLPGAGKAVKGLTGLGKRAVTSGLKKGIKAEARQLAKAAVIRELEQMAEMTAEKFVMAYARELVEEKVEDKIVDMVISPIIDGMIKDIEYELHLQGLL